MRFSKPTIQSVKALEILDSRGNPTLRVSVTLANGVVGSVSVPSGASTGVHEALELRDGDPKRYGCKGVRQAVEHVNQVIALKLLKQDPTNQRSIDEILLHLDGTKNKSKLGANALVGVSLAVARAAAAAAGLPLYRYLRQAFKLPHQTWRLPIPTINILNGGAHADWSLDIQEFMIIPLQNTMAERVPCGAEIFQALGAILIKQGYSALKGDEGGYAPKLKGNEAAFTVILAAIKQAGYVAGTQVKLAIDAAASEFYSSRTKRYELKADNQSLSADELISLEKKWVSQYPLTFIEDGLDQADWDNWQQLTKQLGRRVTLVGDDLFATSADRLKEGIDLHIANAILIKPNQVGTLSETMDAVALAQKHGYKIVVSHRSGETADTTIADLAVAVNAEFIKTGSLSRSERVEKYNRLLEIEQEIGD